MAMKSNNMFILALNEKKSVKSCCGNNIFQCRNFCCLPIVENTQEPILTNILVNR